MRIGVGVFAYNRSNHLACVLEGLKRNEEIEQLYIFQDGLKCEADREDWLKTQQVIKRIDWCKTKSYVSDINRGLADSILKGIEIILEENDAFIVLEDDCVPEPAFISFMRQCLEKYEDKDQVYSVSGYSWPIEIKKRERDIYFCGRPCPWGWGTWKSRWEKYERNYDIIRELKRDKAASQRLASWGDDLEEMLVGNIRGTTDSWYVFWSLQMIKRGKYAINPYKSLIRNIGFDGTGVHCYVSDYFEVKESDNHDRGNIFDLKFDIKIEMETELAFRDLYGSYAVSKGECNRKKVLIYGVGNYFKRNAKRISETYEIVAFLDKYKKDYYYAGIPIIHPRMINKYDYEHILVFIDNQEACREVFKDLTNLYAVDPQYIFEGREEIMCKEARHK